MKQTRLIMDMPITVEIVDLNVRINDINDIFNYFTYIDNTFSTFKKNSEITKINNRLLSENQYSKDMKTVIRLCEETKKEAGGYFDIEKSDKTYDPAGLVKGWAIYQAAKIVQKKGFCNFYIDAGGDIQVSGKNKKVKPWLIGIRNPFNRRENVKIISVDNKGVATSGTYIRGQHIYDPHQKNIDIKDIVSFTVIGPDVYEADRFATAAFAMGRQGINFIDHLFGFEGYMIDINGIATYSRGFNNYVVKEKI